MKAGLADCKSAMKERGGGGVFPLGFVGTSDLIVIGLVSVYISVDPFSIFRIFDKP